jgi:uncharacterized damage-inducible protein DinB
MAPTTKPEVWLRGPLPDISPLLQPVAHALMQAREEVHQQMEGFPDSLLWKQPLPVASVGFHLQHLSGVLDRLFTYARLLPLSDSQLASLAKEGKPVPETSLSTKELVNRFHEQVELALNQLRNTDDQILTDVRLVGRSKVPSTVIGLLVHAAEHTMRHVGQLIVTVQAVRAFKD